MASEEKETPVFIRDRDDRPWFLPMVADIANAEGISRIDAFFIAFCEHWGKKYPRLGERYRAYKEARKQ